MKKVLFIFLCFLPVIGCTKSEEEEKVFNETHIDISFVNANGHDLLSSETQGYFKDTDITVYYLIDGDKVKAFNSDLDFPNYFFVSKDKRNDLYYLRLFPATSYNNVSIINSNKRSISYLKINDVEEKIECEFDQTNGNIECITVWYNNIKVWDKSLGERIIVINK